VKNQELEVKFHVANLADIARRLHSLGAVEILPRVHEINLRFDTPESELAQGYRVLRLRQDSAARLTYKGPSRYQEGVRLRQEIEFVVGDFESARLFLEALGYEVQMMYEKYRTTYGLDGVHITLDEMPYGAFVEIEGPDPESIRRLDDRLGLDWERRVPESYTVIFERLSEAMGLSVRDLSFENFAGKIIRLDSIHVLPADQSGDA
jgi:adenylate cyclase class 2